MSWGRKQWLWFIPFMIFIFLFPIFVNHILKGDKHDFRSDLVIKDTEKRYVNGTIEIIGIIENHGKVNWEHIVAKAELFGKDDKFLDVLTSQISSNLLPGTTEHFKISAREFPEPRWEAIKDLKIKVADASHYRF
jgi:hypothetical protein